jgi:hypothetical protein
MENQYKQSQTKVSPGQLCVADIHKQTNERIYDRNIPSQMLQPYIDVRPVLTKYSYFPIVDPRKQLNVHMKQMPTYNVNKVFNPGNTVSPWSGFASNINIESELRNQVFALQKCSQSVYVPQSSSDLYEYKFKTIKKENPHELLFKKETFEQFNPNPEQEIVGSGIFYNSTRTQVRDLTKQTC